MPLYAVQDDFPEPDGTLPLSLEGFDDLAGTRIRTLEEEPVGAERFLELVVRCEDGEERAGGWLAAESGITLVLPPEADERASVEALLEDLNEVRFYERIADRLEERSALLGSVVTWSAEIVDRLVNYDGMDPGASELARILRKRLSEIHLKVVVGQAECGDWSRLWADEATFDVDDHPIRVDGEVAPRLALEEATAARIGSRLEEIASSLADTERLLAAVRDLVSSMTEGAMDRSNDAMNAVLYWLGILTFFFGIVTVVDKYLSGDTFGFAHFEGLRWTLVAIVPMVAVFFLAMVRHGAALGSVGRLARGLRLRAVDLLFGDWGWIAPSALKRRWIGPTWHDWLEWKITTLLQVDLVGVGLGGTAQEIAAQQAAEDRALGALVEVLDDIGHKHDGLGNGPGRSVASQVRHLRSEALLEIAVAFLLLEMPAPPTSLVAELLLLIRVPRLGIPHLAYRVLGEDGLRRIVAEYTLVGTNVTVPAPEVLRRLKASACTWLRDLDPDRFVTDEGAWDFFVSTFLLGQAGGLDDSTLEAIGDLISDDIVHAFASLRCEALTSPDSDEEPGDEDEQ